MIKLSEVREAYECLSGKASDVCRQLGFAGIGVIWILHNNPSFDEMNDKLITSLLLICFSLGIDLLGYFISTGIWYFIYLKNHSISKLDDTIEIKDPEWINSISWILWGIKIILVIVAFIILATYLFDL